MRRVATFAWLPLLVLAAGCSDLPSEPVPLPEMPALGEPVPLPEDPHRYFDFWAGEWNVQNKNLQKDGTWKDTGTAVALIQPVVDGGAILEQWSGTARGNRLIGSSLRAYDPDFGKWVIYLNWDGGQPGGFFEMHGVRNGERLEQFPPDDDTQSRYSFSLVHEDSAQWDEARSENGEVWITDWVMQFTRREPSLPLDATNAPIIEPPDSAVSFEKTRTLDFLIGAWEGTARALAEDGSWEDGTARARVTSMIEGFALLQFVDTGWGEKTIAALGWDNRADGWIAVRAGNRSDGLLRMAGEPSQDRTVVFTASEGSGLRESWACETVDACTWSREESADAGQTWKRVLEARLNRAASTAAWLDIRNARAPFPDLLTGGQVSEEELAWAARNGYRTVINLRPPGEKDELADEAGLVDQLGMRYVTIPVAGADGVTEENAKRLADALSTADALPAIVHCASGNRVGALFALQAHAEGAAAEEALDVGLSAGLTRLEPVVRERLGLPAPAAASK